MKTVHLGIVGTGLMGREIGSAVARWCHLTDIDVRPEIVAVCGRTGKQVPWVHKAFPTVTH